MKKCLPLHPLSRGNALIAPCDGIEREFFERFSIQTSSTRSCTVMSSLYRVNELTVNLRF